MANGEWRMANGELLAFLELLELLEFWHFWNFGILNFGILFGKAPQNSVVFVVEYFSLSYTETRSVITVLHIRT